MLHVILYTHYKLGGAYSGFVILCSRKSKSSSEKSQNSNQSLTSIDSFIFFSLYFDQKCSLGPFICLTLPDVSTTSI